jgi:hypothetical protein
MLDDQVQSPKPEIRNPNQTSKDNNESGAATLPFRICRLIRASGFGFLVCQP